MSVYRYSARRLSGELVRGEGAAASAGELARRLSAEGMVLVDAKPLGRALPGFGLLAPRRVRLSALMSFVREFRALSGAGMPLARALAQVETRRDDPLLAGALAATRTAVERGQSLDAAMAEHPEVFDSLVRTTVRAGITTGRLEEALERLLAFLALRYQLVRKVRRALAYPVFLLVLLVVTLTLLMLFVLPRFAELYAEFDAVLPWPTQVLMAAVRAAPVAIPAIAATIVALVMLFRLWVAVPASRLAFDRFRLRLPVIGPIALNTGLIQASFMLSMLLRAGVPLREGLRFAADSLGNADLRLRLSEAGNAVASGRSLSDALTGQAIYPELSRSLLAAGETAGDLDRMFSEVARLHEEALEDRLDRVIALIEPAMMLIVGIVLGAVIVAVYLPIFGISAVVE